MKIFLMIGVTMCIIFGLFYLQGGQIDTKTLIQNMSTLENRTFNITTTQIQYTSMYNKEPNLKDAIINLIHGWSYGLIVEANTIVPIMLYAVTNKDFVMTLFWWILLGLCVVFIIPILKFFIILYFFIKEKKKDKIEWYK